MSTYDELMDELCEDSGLDEGLPPAGKWGPATRVVMQAGSKEAESLQSYIEQIKRVGTEIGRIAPGHLPDDEAYRDDVDDQLSPVYQNLAKARQHASLAANALVRFKMWLKKNPRR